MRAPAYASGEPAHQLQQGGGERLSGLLAAVERPADRVGHVIAALTCATGASARDVRDQRSGPLHGV